MNNFDIKRWVKKCYKDIEVASETLKKIRKKCPHTIVKEEDYMWRIGSIRKANICQTCGEVIKENIINGTKSNR